MAAIGWQASEVVAAGVVLASIISKRLSRIATPFGGLAYT